MGRPVKVSWARFSVLVVIMSLFPGLALYAGIMNGDPAAGIAMTLMLAILLGFLATGWRRLRHAHSAEPIDSSQLERIILLMFGPPIPAVLWLVAAFATPFIVLIIDLASRQ
jgi:high-affinity Fe2+/Pb2+ permease